MKLDTWLAISLVGWLVSFGSALSTERLAKQAAKDGGIIGLTNGNFKRILSGPRDAYIVVLMTATNPQIGCQLCTELAPEYTALAQAWVGTHSGGVSAAEPHQGLFFAKLDFAVPHSNEVFSHYQINNVPRLLLFSPGGDLDSYELLGIPSQTGGARVRAFVDILKGYTGIQDFEYHEPVNWGQYATIAMLAVPVVVLLRKYWSAVVSIATFRPLWGFSCVSIVIALISGAMFNKIKETPYVGASSDGNYVQYFAARQQQFQFGVETQIVSFIYGILSAVVVLLAVGTKSIRAYYVKYNYSMHAVVHLLLSLAALLLIYMSFAALLAVFKLKNFEYPFRLFKSPFR
ncbi:AaceriAER413Cp [[Ashbya] aceris (nom. inval.)]|nr:AaceriAER413Cp [[Ashbya] aceris (nom. inval.)]